MSNVEKLKVEEEKIAGLAVYAVVINQGLFGLSAALTSTTKDYADIMATLGKFRTKGDDSVYI